MTDSINAPRRASSGGIGGGIGGGVGRGVGRGLGRGLGALIVDTSSAPVEKTLQPQPTGVQACAIEAIQPNPQQPRVHFDEESLKELAASIQVHGIIQPLIVTENPQTPGTYWLIAGERRWRAAHLAKLTTVPIVIREASSQQLVELALIENIQRADLNPLEEGSAYQTLIEEFGLTHGEIAERVGKSRSAITNTVRLLEAPATLQKAVTDNVISAGHARALLGLKEAALMETILQQVVQQTLNVRQTEALVKRLMEAASATAAEHSIDETAPKESATEDQLGHLENRFRTALGTRVNLSRNTNGSGRLVIHFYNDEDLNNIFHLITGGEES